jgi:hypothetical protein
MFTGDGPSIWIAPLVFGILTITSWTLRPTDRRMTPVHADVEQRAAQGWVVPLLSAYHMVRNVASKRVLERLGMSQEGCLRSRVRKWGVFEDVLVWASVCTKRAAPTR